MWTAAIAAGLARRFRVDERAASGPPSRTVTVDCGDRARPRKSGLGEHREQLPTAHHRARRSVHVHADRSEDRSYPHRARCGYQLQRAAARHPRQQSFVRRGARPAVRVDDPEKHRNRHVRGAARRRSRPAGGWRSRFATICRLTRSVATTSYTSARLSVWVRWRATTNCAHVIDSTPQGRGSSISTRSKVYSPEGTLAGQRLDYALFAKFPGPAGNHIMIFTSGLRNAGLLENVRTLTSPEGLATPRGQGARQNRRRAPRFVRSTYHGDGLCAH